MKIVGLMSGTSLDGLDMVLTEFSGDGSFINYKILKADTRPYPDDLKTRLADAHQLSGYELTRLHKEYGQYCGKSVKQFLADETADFIASHGHTVFHEPENQLSLQIGDGAFIAAEAKISVISDFRNIDLAFGGQGAPLVPLGDKLLFSDYESCINIGGFVNISYDDKGVRKAFDICPGNRAANRLAAETGAEYDDKGMLGSKGRLIEDLLNELNALRYYQKDGPKSLGREWDEQIFMPIFEKYKQQSVNDLLHTLYEHIAEKIADSLPGEGFGKVLITGGGAYNSYLIRRIKSKVKQRIIIPEDTLIQYKEALIFALLGLLRAGKANNILASYTGASRNTTGGIIHYV